MTSTIFNSSGAFLAFYRMKLTSNVKLCVKFKELHAAKRTAVKVNFFSYLPRQS